MLKDLWKALQQQWARNDIVTRANALAFGLLVSFLPVLILILFSLSYSYPLIQKYFALKKQDFNLMVWQQLGLVIPLATDDMQRLMSFIKNNWTTGSAKKILSVSFFLSILYASQAMWLIVKSFESHGLSSANKRPYIFKRLLSVYLTLFFSMIASAITILFMMLNIFLPKILLLLGFTAKSLFLIKFVQLALIALMLYFSLSIIYKFGNVERFAWFSWGAFLSSGLILASSLALLPMLIKFSTHHLIYGPLSALLFLAIWFQVSSCAIFIGQDLNMALLDIRRNRRKV